MKIYQVCYIGDDDNTYMEYFSSRGAASKRRMELKKEHKKISFDDESTVKAVYDISKFDCVMNKKGILDLLNNHFCEKAG